MQTTTQTITAPLPVIHDLARIGALYASDDPQRAPLQLVTINPTATGIEATTTDSYALAVWATTGDYSLTESVSVNAHELHKATAAAVKAIGKRNAAHVPADLTITPDSWTLTAGPLTTTSSRSNIETPNLAPIREAMTQQNPEHFEPYNMAAFQMARLAKLNPTGPDAAITQKTYAGPLKPITYRTEYTVNEHQVTVEVLAMPMRTK